MKSKCGNGFTIKIVSIFDVHMDDVLTIIGMVSPWISFIHGDLIGVISTFFAVETCINHFANIFWVNMLINDCFVSSVRAESEGNSYW